MSHLLACSGWQFALFLDLVSIYTEGRAEIRVLHETTILRLSDRHGWPTCVRPAL